MVFLALPIATISAVLSFRKPSVAPSKRQRWDRDAILAVPALVRPRTMYNLDREERICSHHLPDIIPINVPYCGINKAVRDFSALPIRWQTQ